MRQRLSQLFQVPGDLDYVGGFQALSQLNLEIRRDGPSIARLLRKSLLERTVGNHAASLGAAQQALDLDPLSSEVRYELGLAYFFLALAKADALPVGPRVLALPAQGVAQLLGLAVGQFRRVVELNPSDDEAAKDVAALTEVLAVGADDVALARALRERGP